TGAPAPPPTAGTQSGEPPFVGRSRESEALLATLAEVRDRRAPVVLHLRGRSGHGKSALLRRFIAALAGNGDGDGDDGAPTVLRGRCRERESVPYKGVDAALDALALHLRTRPKDERDRLRPDYADALVQVFPAFAELWPVARTDFDPQEARSLAWAALREILESLAGRAPVVLVLDDFQWTDPESVSLLRTLCRPPRAPALLLLLSTRDLVGEAARRWLEELAATDEPSLRRVELGPLLDAEARALALSLLSARHGFDPAPGGADPLGTRAAAIALRCAGSPFFIQQMVLEQDLDDAGDPILGEDLDQIVIRRLDALPAANRAALEAIAVAGGPIAQSRVLTLEPEADAETIVMLCDGGLLVRSEGSDPQVEVAHDRIREAALAALDPQRAGRLHWQLGRRLLDDARKTEDGPLGDSVFAIVEHLAAGLDAARASTLSDEHRRELASLHLEAGERSAAVGAWQLAGRDYARGVELVAPWIDDATRGRERLPGLRALCVALCFGRAQARAMDESPTADDDFAALLSWSLEPAEIGQIAGRRVAILAWFNDLEAALAFGFAQLAQLGLPLPRRPSLLRGLFELGRGWWALGRCTLPEILSLEEMRSPVVRAQLDVLVEVSFVAPYVDPQLILTLAGVAVRTIRRHGLHPGLARSLTQMALALNALGKARSAAALCDRALALAEHQQLRPAERVNARVQAQFLIWPCSRPLPELMADVEDRYREACDAGRTFEAGYMAVAAGFSFFEIDRPLHEVVALFERFERRNPDFGHTVNRPGLAMVRRHLETLIAGKPSLRSDELGPTIPFLRYLGLTLELTTALLFLDWDRATALMDAMPADYDEVMLGVLQIPRYAMTCTILEARRCRQGAGSRRRALRRIGKHRRTARHWAAQGPENFTAMALIIEAELAELRGRSDLARDHLERARDHAREHGASSVLALSQLQRAAWFSRREQSAERDAAFAEALA
ncbi:MAG: AAA family ATPase, partial [Myxococcales bacterium]|nr:AAA family ATPase [Myxococcales bacterium]